MARRFQLVDIHGDPDHFMLSLSRRHFWLLAVKAARDIVEVCKGDLEHLFGRHEVLISDLTLKLSPVIQAQMLEAQTELVFLAVETLAESPDAGDFLRASGIFEDDDKTITVLVKALEVLQSRINEYRDESHNVFPGYNSLKGFLTKDWTKNCVEVRFLVEKGYI